MITDDHAGERTVGRPWGSVGAPVGDLAASVGDRFGFDEAAPGAVRSQFSNETAPGPDGHPYRHAGCAAAAAPAASVNASTSPDRVRAFTAAATADDLPDGTGSWVVSNVTQVLRENGLVDRSGNLTLESNQALFVHDLPAGAPGDGDYNDEVVLVEVGHSTDEVRVEYAVSVTVQDVRLGSSS